MEEKHKLCEKVRQQANIDSIRERTHLTAEDIAYLLSRTVTKKKNNGTIKHIG